MLYIKVNISKAGNVDFDAKVVAPSGTVLPVNIEGTHIKKVKFITKEAGVHRISLLLAGHTIAGKFLSLQSDFCTLITYY